MQIVKAATATEAAVSFVHGLTHVRREARDPVGGHALVMPAPPHVRLAVGLEHPGPAPAARALGRLPMRQRRTPKIDRLGLWLGLGFGGHADWLSQHPVIREAFPSVICEE